MVNHQAVQTVCPMTKAEAIQQLVRELLKVAGGELDINVGEQLLDPAVLMHMSGLSLKGRKGWRTFIRYVRWKRGIAGLHLRYDRVEVDGDLATFYGQWQSEHGELIMPNVEAVFRIEGDRVMEIWSKPSNYVALFGERILSFWGFRMFALRAFLWSRFN
ncbi:MAG: hypothetical protein ACI8X3_002900 [Saprospiraceae bacterium]|jgi:hypothetical protein